MIYRVPQPDEMLDQGDLLDDCPVALVAGQFVGQSEKSKVDLDAHRVIVLTQTCDLANEKARLIVVASIFDAQYVIDAGIAKAGDIKGPIHAGRTFGLYFLPAHADTGIGEMIVDFRRLHTVPLQTLRDLIAADKRRLRLLTPYREHLAKHFADTYSRIGLPQPYETL
jgi:hypothetical protein